ncbi:MAG: hypothetical protein Kow0090_05130 [Myxococcota bacterium]
MKKTLSYILASLLGVLALVIIELILGFFIPDMPYKVLDFHPTCAYTPKPNLKITAQSGLFSPQPCRSGSVKHTLSINELGERFVPESRADAPKTVMVIGDSCSFGWDVSDDETFANYIARLAGEEGSEIAVRLFAVPGYSSLEGFIRYTNYINEDGKPPDIAIIAFGANDDDPVGGTWWRNGWTDYELHHFDGKSFGEVDNEVFFRMFIAGLNLTRVIAMLAGEYEKPPDEGKRRMTADETEYIINGFVSLLLTQESKVILHNLCSVSRNASIRTVSARRSVPFVDSERALKGEWRSILTPDEVSRAEETAKRLFSPQCLAEFPAMLVTSDNFHPNRYGHKVVAKALWGSLRPLVIDTHHPPSE